MPTLITLQLLRATLLFTCSSSLLVSLYPSSWKSNACRCPNCQTAKESCLKMPRKYSHQVICSIICPTARVSDSWPKLWGESMFWGFWRSRDTSCSVHWLGYHCAKYMLSFPHSINHTTQTMIRLKPDTMKICPKPNCMFICRSRTSLCQYKQDIYLLICVSAVNR